MAIGDYTAVPSAKFNDSHVKGALATRMNSTNNVLLFPIYKKITGPGSGAVFDIVGWVGFKVTDYDANGSSGTVYGSFTAGDLGGHSVRVRGQPQLRSALGRTHRIATSTREGK